MVITDARQPDTPIVLANQAFLDLTGYSADEIIGRNCRILQGPETDAAAIEEIRRGLAEDRHFIEVELLNYRKDGSTFWNRLSISPVHDAHGRTIYYVASQIDGTARRRAQELAAIERLLLMEVDHRALNALAQVQSILSLTQAETIHGYSRAVGQRVDAIARVHRMLAAESWTGIDLRSLLASELEGAAVSARGPAVHLPPRLAQPVGIILHEMGANTRQHGALAARGGA